MKTTFATYAEAYKFAKTTGREFSIERVMDKWTDGWMVVVK